jgi:integrase
MPKVVFMIAKNGRIKPTREKTRRGRGDRDVFYCETQGLWVGQLSYTDPKTGNRSRPRVYGKSEKQCRDKMKAMEKDIDGEIRRRSEGKSSLSEWLDSWFEKFQLGKIRVKSRERQELTIEKYIKPHIGAIKLKHLTTEDIQGLYSMLATKGKMNGSGLSSQSVRHVHNTLSKALRKAHELGKIKTNPVIGTEPPSLKSRKASVNIMTENQIKLFLRTAKEQPFLKEPKEHRHYVCFLAGFSTGLRRGELLALSWDDVNLSKMQATVRRSLVTSNKNGPVFEFPKTEESARTIPLSADLCAALKRHKAKQAEEEMAAKAKAVEDAKIHGVAVDMEEYYQNSGLVFRQEDGRRVDPRSFSRTFKFILRKAGLPSTFRVHDMRHCFASVMIKRGCDIKRIQKLLGHASSEVTLDTYAHLFDGALEDAVAKLQGVFVETAQEDEVVGS